MSITGTLAALQTRLVALPSPTVPVRVYADPKESVSLGEFPCIILCLAPGVEHRLSEVTMGSPGFGYHAYTVGIYVLLGQRATNIAELHSRALPWPAALYTKLVADLTLGGTVVSIGSGEATEPLMTYTLGPITWADGVYWGLKCLLPVSEKLSVPIG